MIGSSFFERLQIVLFHISATLFLKKLVAVNELTFKDKFVDFIFLSLNAKKLNISAGVMIIIHEVHNVEGSISIFVSNMEYMSTNTIN